MEYRTNQRTGDRISVIGIGSAYIADADEGEALEALELAYENGVNYVDTVAASAEGFALYGKAFEKVRNKMFYQVHFGAEYSTGKYGWTTDAEVIKRWVDWQLKQLRTDYIDYGFIHCLDERADWDFYRKDGALDYLLRLKDQGVVRHLGLSSHTPGLVETVLDDGLDIALINKYYDLAKMGDTLAEDHYDKLEKHASDCMQCGHCNDRCPFKVDQMKRMDEIAEYFKK